MNTYKIMLLLIALSGTAQGFKSFYFDLQVEMEGICERKVLLSFEEYIEDLIFKEYYNNMRTHNKLDSDVLVNNYTDHRMLIQKYIEDIIKRDPEMTNYRLNQKAQIYIISKINYIFKKIHGIVQNDVKNPNLVYFVNDKIFNEEEMKNLNSENFVKIVIRNQMKFDSLYDGDFMTELKDFVGNEIENEQPIYFEDEFCRLLDELIPVLEYYFNLEQVEDNEEIVETLSQFFDQFLKFRAQGICQSSLPTFRFNYLTFIFGDKENQIEEQLKNPIPEVPNQEKIFDLYLEDYPEGSPEEIAKMDKNFLHLDQNLYDLPMETIIDYKKHPHHFSFDFMEYLDKLKPLIFENLKKKQAEKDPKIKKDPQFEQSSTNLTLFLYKLYTYARATDWIPEDFDKDHDKILERLIQLSLDPRFKKLPEDQGDEEDQPMRESKLTKPEVRKNFLLLFPHIRPKKQDNMPIEGLVLPPDEYEMQKKDIVKKAIQSFGHAQNIHSFIEENEDLIEEPMKEEFVNHTMDIKFEEISQRIKVRSKKKPTYAKRSEKPISEDSQEIEDVDIIINTMSSQFPEVKDSQEPMDLVTQLKKKMMDNLLIDKFLDQIDKESPKEENEWKRILFLLVRRVKELNKETPDSFWIKINKRLISRLKSNVHRVKGYFKLLKWALSRRETFFPQALDLEYDEDTTHDDYQQQIYNQKFLLNVDNVLFVKFAEEDLESRPNQDHFKDEATDYWYNKFHGKEYEEFYENNILKEPILIDRFHSFEFFFQLVDIFHMFDNEEISTPELKDVYGNLFLNIYRFILDTREMIEEEESDPIQLTILNLENCIEEKFSLDDESKASLSCTLDYRAYMEMYWFFKFYRYQKTNDYDDPQNKEDFFKADIDDFFVVDSSSFIIYMSKLKDEDANMDKLCNLEEEQDQNDHYNLCMEYGIFKNSMQNIFFDGYQTFYDIVFKDYEEQITEYPNIAWNVIETIKRYNHLEFNKFLNMKENNQDPSKSLLSILNVESPDEEWFLSYLKYNFSHYSKHYRGLQQAVQYIYDNNKLEEYLFNVDKFSYHGFSDERQVFHLKAIAPFLYFGHSSENYEKLSQFIYKQGWLILLFKNPDFEKYDDFMVRLREKEWLPVKDETSPRENAELLKIFLHQNYPKPIENKTVSKVKPAKGNLMAKLKAKQAKKQGKSSKNAVPIAKDEDLKVKLKQGIIKRVEVEGITLKSDRSGKKVQQKFSLGDFENLLEEGQSDEEEEEEVIIQDRNYVSIADNQIFQKEEAEVFMELAQKFKINKATKELIKNKDYDNLKEWLETEHLSVQHSFEFQKKLIDFLSDKLDSADPLVMELDIGSEEEEEHLQLVI